MKEQVFYAMTVGKFEKGHRIMLVKNPWKPLVVEFSQWNEKLNPPQWQLIGYYYPKFRPECGRKIDEYDRSKFDE